MKRKLLILFLLVFMFLLPVNANEDKYTIVSGNLETVGSEVCLGEECFYVIGNDGNNVKLFAKYNLLVGNSYDGTNAVALEKTTGIQDPTAIGWFNGYTADNPLIGTYPFYERDYWSSSTSNYPAYVYNEKSLIYPFVENYESYLINKGVALSDARLISYEELLELGCDGDDLTCKNAPKWVWSTTYWTGSVKGSQYWVTFVYSHGGFFSNSAKHNFGVRPVIEVPLGWFNEEGSIYTGIVKKIKTSDGVISNYDNRVDIVFNDLDQEAKYEAIIHNDTDKNMYVNDINVSQLSEEFIEVRLDENSKDMMIEANGSSRVVFYINTLLKEGAGRNLNDEVKINFVLSENGIKNPPTYSDILEFLILVIIFIGVHFLIYKKSKNKKIATLVILSLIIGSSIIVYAENGIVVEMNGKIEYKSLNILETTGTALNNGVDYSKSKDVWKYHNQVKNIKISSLINEPKKYVEKFDLSMNDNERVLGYLVENNDKDIPYDLYIMSKGIIVGNIDSSFLFSFSSVEKIEGLNNIDFRNTKSMKGMFIGDKKLTGISSNDFEMNNVSDVSYMFYECNDINLEEKDFSLEDDVNKEFMFTTYLYNVVKSDNILDLDFSKYVSTTGDKSGKYVMNGTDNNEFPIYFFRGNVSNNNVKFANFCWKIVRTTETGGIKLIYNGVPSSDGSCNNTGTNTTIGMSKFNDKSSSPSDISYMYGKRFEYKRTDFVYNVLSKSYFLGRDYYYGDSVVYSNGKYVLQNTKKYKWDSNYEDIKGYYTCLSSTSCTSVYYVVGGDTTYAYLLNLVSGRNIDDYSFKVGKGYNDNGNGTYTLTDIVTVKNVDWYKDYSKYKNYYFCPNSINSDTCNLVSKVDFTDYSILAYKINENYLYGNDVEYKDGRYKLIDTYKSTKGFYLDKSNIQRKYHYTCFSSSDTCDKVYYLVYFDTGYFYYLTLDGETNIDAVNEAMYSPNNNSTIKNKIDTWYKENMVSYTSYLEDTVWCNDKSYHYGPLMSKDSTNSTNVFSGDYRNTVGYKPSLKCENINDRYTVSKENGNGALTYPVGILTADEVSYAGSGWRNTVLNGYLKNGLSNWVLTPAYYGYDFARGFAVQSNNALVIPASNFSDHVRPAISLEHDVIYVSGDGSFEKPYVIK